MTDRDLRTLLRSHVEVDEPPTPPPNRAIALGHTRIRRRRTWIIAGAAAAAVVFSLAIALPRLGDISAPAGPSSPSPSPAPTTHASLTLLPPSCTAADHLRLGKVTDNGAGGDLFMEWPLLTDHPCTLSGYPSVRLLEASGKAPAIQYKYRWPWFGSGSKAKNAPVEPVVVNDTTALTVVGVHKTTIHAGAFIEIEKYRCDVTRNPARLTKAEITLPIAGSHALVGTMRDDYQVCDPRLDGQPPVYVSPVQTNAKPAPYAVSLRSSFGPGDHPTWGRADVDGDGRPDTVILEPRRYKPSLLVVHLADGKTVQAATDYSEPVRLQALGDLNGDGRSEILVATTALGADYHGVFADGITEVFRVVAGQLRPVMRGAKPWQLTFALDGEGGVYSGVVCQGATVTQVRAVVQGKVTRTTFRIEGDQAVLVSRTAGLATGSGQQYAVSPCPGMSSDGWAEPPAG